MRIDEVEIHRFRSIEKLKLKPKALTTLCGVNSSGKSNVLRAIKFAFLRDYDGSRMNENINNLAEGGNSSAAVKLTFSAPTPAVCKVLSISAAKPFTYQVSVKRNGRYRCTVNGIQITDGVRNAFLDCILIVHVPVLRDIESTGLDPLREAMVDALRRTRGAGSFASVASTLQKLIKNKGRQLLQDSSDLSKKILRVDALVVESDLLDPELLVPATHVRFRLNGKDLGIEKLGTGHQSSFIIDLYRQVGIGASKFVLFLFEEPDNHLHPTSLRAVADDLKHCAESPDSQVFLTTHSPYLIHHFAYDGVVVLKTDSRRLTKLVEQRNLRSDRDLRIAFSKFGLKPAEALLSRRVVVVEGAADVTLFRVLIELKTKQTADQHDVAVVSAGGKGGVAELCKLLEELGAEWMAVLDWDATFDTSMPMFSSLTAADKAAIAQSLNDVEVKLATRPKGRSAAQKMIEAMTAEVTGRTHIQSFKNSYLGKLVSDVLGFQAPDLAALEQAIQSGVQKSYRGILTPKNVWLWSGLPEELLLPNPGAEALVEQLLMNQNHLKQAVLPGPIRRRTLVNKLHELANVPVHHTEIITNLWNQGFLTSRELNAAVTFAVA